jgi:hypothetical protein
MNERQAKTLVIVGTSGAAMLASAEAIATGRPPSVRIGVGAVVAGSVLYALAGFIPPVAGGLALVMLTGSVLTNGATVAAILQRATGRAR